MAKNRFPPVPAVADAAPVKEIVLEGDGERLDGLGDSERLPIKRYQVSLPGVVVNVVDPEKGTGIRQDYLVVEAASPELAIEEFGRYNGIPWQTDSLTGERRLWSIHRPTVIELPAEGSDALDLRALSGELGTLVEG